ncbi:MAG: shikimate kinase [Ferruginibacter sp.]
MKIFLIGFMGSGKSFLGKLWADDNHLPFYDLDYLIEEEERMTIDKIFATYGEDYFREQEAAALRNTERFTNAIIACGGGTPCYFDNMHWMNKNAVTVFLNETEDKIYRNVHNDKKVRPLILGQNDKNLQSFITTKLKDRLPFYNQSQIMLLSHQLNKDGFAIIENYLNDLVNN